MAGRLTNLLKRLFLIPYEPSPDVRGFMARAQTQDHPTARVTVAVLDAIESHQYFGVAMARRGLQPVFLRVENRSTAPLRLQFVRIDPNYYTPLEAAALNHFSIGKRLSAFGVIGWFFLPFLALMPSKLISAWRANQRIDDFFRSQAFHLRPIAPGTAAEGFVFTTLDAGTKFIDVSLYSTGDTLSKAVANLEPFEAAQATVDLSFSIPVPGIAADYLRRDFTAIEAGDAPVEYDVADLIKHLRAMPPATTNAAGSRSGDPVNLVIIGTFDLVLATFAARWDESETITFATCWKTVRSFLLGTQYRYSPVSPLHLFNRSQDVARAALATLDQRAPALAVVAHAAALRAAMGLGGPGEPRYRRAVHDARLESDHASDRPRR